MDSPAGCEIVTEIPPEAPESKKDLADAGGGIMMAKMVTAHPG